MKKGGSRIIRLIETDRGKVGIMERFDEVFRSSQDVLDAIADLCYQECDRFIFYKENFPEDFYDLRTGLAGDILQKMSTYYIKLAIVGDFSGYTSKSLKAFIYESNRGKQNFFVASEEEAMKALGLS